MTLWYSLGVKRREMLYRFPFTAVSVASLALGFLFIIVFTAKIGSVDRRIVNLLESNKNPEATVYQLKELSDSKPIGRSSQSINAYVYVDVDGSKSKELAVFVDERFTDYVGISGVSSDAFHTFVESADQVMMDSHLARQYDVVSGDRMVLEGEVFHVFAVIDFEYLEGSFILSTKNTDLVARLAYPRVTVYTQGDLIHPKSTIENRQRLGDKIAGEVASLERFKDFMRVFALIFIVLSVLNCYLIFWARMAQEVRNRMIKRLQGQRRAHIFLEILIENTVLSGLAFHMSWLMLNRWDRWLPTFFYERWTGAVYGISLGIALGIGVLYSLFQYARIQKASMIKQIRES